MVVAPAGRMKDGDVVAAVYGAHGDLVLLAAAQQRTVSTQWITTDG